MRICPPRSKTSRPGSSRSGTLFDLPTKLSRRKELEAKMGEGTFWDNQDAAKSVVAEMKTLKAAADPVEEMLRGIDDVRAMYQLGAEAKDQDTIEEADRELAKLEKRFSQVELQALLDGPNDPKNCFFSIQSG